ncbi:MAG: cyclic pyranopterin monophosphate synthase MoaC [Lachnospiraceae bacterium]|nr:cyclic pyranopterin monophosphate synthase MoaC [Lachnospiraceae bacterium]
MKGMVFGIAGFSGSGKTTLIEKLIPILKNDGFSVAAIKHDAHDFDMDREGKDTYRFTAAGADTVMISSQTGSAVLSNSPEDLDDMIMDAYVRGADIVLVEGYKNADIPKLLVLTNRCGYSIPDDLKNCVAIAADDLEKAGNICDLPVFDVDDAAVIADFIKDMLMDERKRLSHFDDEGNARMVDVSDKDITVRTAVAAGRVMVNNTTFDLIKNSGIKKGDVLTVAQIAGIMGAKRTPDLIPMCHPIITDGTDVRLKLNSDECCIDIEAEVKCKGRTGVEMEAICACSVAAMTVYDMCKSVQRDIVISDIRLISKSGGVHGDYRREE